MINCVIVDDEPLAREGIANYVHEIDFLNLIATCESPVQLMPLMASTPVDLLFLDIQMPHINGLEFLKIIEHRPFVIITTAFAEYAVESFQLNVTDYLLKPVEFDQFLKSVHKVKYYHDLVNQSNQKPGAAPDYFFIKTKSKYEKVFYNEVLFVEAMQNYVAVYTSKNKYVTLLTLKSIEENLDKNSFIRVHKSFIVSKDKINSIGNDEIMIDKYKIPIGLNYRRQILQELVESKLWNKSKS